jgi:hypothetical protein
VPHQQRGHDYPINRQPFSAQVSGHALLREAPSLGFADTLSSAAYGLLEAQASASTTFAPGLQIEMDGAADAAFRDTWLVTPAATGGKPVGTPVSVLLTVAFSASIGTPLGSGEGNFGSDARLIVRVGSNIFCPICPPDLLLLDTSNVNQPFTEVQSLLIPTEVGGDISALVQLIAGADNIPDPVSGHGFTLVDAAQSAKIFLDAPTGVDLISGSGHDYSTPAAAIPEPSTLFLLAFSLAGLGGVAWRRKDERTKLALRKNSPAECKTQF